MKYLPPDPNEPRVAEFGIVIGVAPTDPTYRIEFERAPDSAGSPDTGAAVSLGERIYAPINDSLVDSLPNDGARRHYRARHTVPGGAAGAWSAWISAIPAEMAPEYPAPSRTAVLDGVADGATYKRTTTNEKTGAGRGFNALNSSNRLTGGLEGNQNHVAGDLYIETTKSLKWGSTGTPGVKTRPLRFPAAILQQSFPTQPLSYGIGTVVPDVAAQTVAGTAAIVLPDGATITTVKFRGVRENSADIAKAEWYRIADSGAATLIATTEITSPALGGQTITATLSEAIAGTQYVVRVTLRGDAGANDAAAIWMEVDYTVPDVSVAY